MWRRRAEKGGGNEVIDVEVIHFQTFFFDRPFPLVLTSVLYFLIIIVSLLQRPRGEIGVQLVSESVSSLLELAA